MRRKARRTIIEANASHPDSWDNPANEEALLNLARAIGRKIARDQGNGLIGPIVGEDGDGKKRIDGDNHTKKSGGNIRSLFKQDAKKDLD